MNVKLDKSKFSIIDTAFVMLKSHPESIPPTTIIAKALEDCFNCSFQINVVNPEPNADLFVMSVYPEISVIDKIVSAVMSDSDTKAIQKLWETNKNWTIEIDSRILNDQIIPTTNRELTAMLLHEVGHIVCSSSIPNRISLILRYEIMKSSMKSKMMLKDRIFRSILSLPILDSCISDTKRNGSSIREEIKADTFVKKMGYSAELLSVLTKLSKNIKYPNDGTINDKMIKNANFSISTLDDFQARKVNLAKKSLLSLRESCMSPYIQGVIDGFVETVFEGSEDGNSVTSEKKIEYMLERADKDIEDGYYTEFFIFGKELKRIDPAEIDYIQVKISSMKNDNDRMMLISYLHSKLDLVEYYISILENPKLAKRYRIPHTLNQLYDLKKRLLIMRRTILDYKIPMRNNSILVSWPTGYGG